VGRRVGAVERARAESERKEVEKVIPRSRTSAMRAHLEAKTETNVGRKEETQKRDQIEEIKEKR